MSLYNLIEMTSISSFKVLVLVLHEKKNLQIEENVNVHSWLNALAIYCSRKVSNLLMIPLIKESASSRVMRSVGPKTPISKALCLIVASTSTDGYKDIRYILDLDIRDIYGRIFWFWGGGGRKGRKFTSAYQV